MIWMKRKLALLKEINSDAALYFNPDILLLDEPTSSLDRENEEKIIETILDLSKQITVIISTHKINNLPNNLDLGALDNKGNITVRKT